MFLQLLETWCIKGDQRREIHFADILMLTESLAWCMIQRDTTNTLSFHHQMFSSSHHLTYKPKLIANNKIQSHNAEDLVEHKS